MARSTALALGSAGALLLSSSIAHASNDIKSIAGDWGCNFNTPDGPVGPVGGVAIASINKKGKVNGTQTIATEDMALFSLPITGDIEFQPDHTFLLTIKVDLGGGEEESEHACVAVDRSGRRFEQFNCIDVTAELGPSISYTTCNRR